MKRMISPLRSFDLRPGKSRLKVQVRIYTHRKAMLQAIRSDTVGGIENSTLAACCAATLTTGPEYAAIVFLDRKNMDHDTVAHEMVHAASNVIERRRRRIGTPLQKPLPLDHALEEGLASIVGILTGLFYKSL